MCKPCVYGKCFCVLVFAVIVEPTLPTSLCREGPVFVIGSGISGLVAARSLQEFGCNVTIFEALGRPGGRTHTFSTGPFAGVEEGAHWVHGGVDNLPSSQLLSFLDVKQVRVGGDSNWEGGRELLKIFVDGSKEPLSSELRDSSFDLFQTANAALSNFADDTYTGKEARNVSVATAWKKALGDINYTKFNELALRWHQRIVFEQDEGASISQCNVASEFFDDYTDFYRDGMKAGWERHGDAFVKGGYSAVVQKLSEGLDIRLHTAVNDVIYSGQGVTLHTSKSTVSGAAVLVTASIGALQAGKPKFHPALPKAKNAALHRLAMGNVAKILIRLGKDVDEHVLGSYSTGRFTAADQLLTYCIRHAYEQAGSPVLECFLGGDAASAAEKMDLPTLHDQVQVELASIFGNSTGMIENVSITQWSSNPYIGGAWSYAPLGASAKDFDRLAEPVGRRVYFAGEGTCRMLYGNVHAAVVSGARAAHSILDLGDNSPHWPFFQDDLLKLCTDAPSNHQHRTAPKAHLRLARFQKIVDEKSLYV